MHSAAAALFAHLSASSTAAPPNTAPLQQVSSRTTTSGDSAVPQLQPDSTTVSAPLLPVLSSCPNTSNPLGTALSDAASALLAHLSAMAPVLVPVETVLEDEPALSRAVTIVIKLLMICLMVFGSVTFPNFRPILANEKQFSASNAHV